eukprot:TRINITY_DN13271_c1_g4_i2.p1 TRINITY_DN13271_c1_g4~~TRINITY_DN13271_c1_g4_i2.p1  ORF type:complete len:693 (+),score=82.97 TRINITY_DN13271_c1_g4_i2:306-2081(+)
MGDMGSVLMMMDQMADAEQQFENAVSILRRLGGSEVETLAKALLMLASTRQSVGELGRAKEALQEALDVVEPGPLRAAVLNHLGDVLLNIGEVSTALDHFQDALGSQPDKDVLLNIGLAYQHMGQYQDALDHYRRAEALCKDSPRLLMEVYDRMGAVHRMMGELSTALGLLKRSLEIAEETNAGVGERARILMGIGEVQAALGSQSEAIKTLCAIVATYEAAGMMATMEAASAVSNLGVLYLSANDCEKSLEACRRAAELKEKIFGTTTHPEVAADLMNSALALSGLGSFQEAAATFETSLKIFLETLGEDHPTTALVYHNTGKCLVHADAPRRAVGYLKKAAEIRGRILPGVHQDTALTLRMLGLALIMFGEVAEAAEHINKAIEIYECFGMDEESAAVLHTLGSGWGSNDDYQSALDCFLKELSIRRRIATEDTLDTAATLFSVATALTKMNDFAKAAEYHTEALTIRQRHHGDTPHPDVINSLNETGAAHLRSGNPTTALEYLTKGIAMHRSIDPTHEDIVTSLYNMGIAYTELGNLQEALTHHKEALLMREAAFGPHHRVSIESRQRIGEIYSSLGDAEKAEEYLKA